MTTRLPGVFVLTGTQHGLAGSPTITLPFPLATTAQPAATAIKPADPGRLPTGTAPSSPVTHRQSAAAVLNAAHELTAPVPRPHGPSRSQQIIVLMRARAARRIAARAQQDSPE